MNEYSPQHTHYDDEISLVDLAKILIKRWEAMAEMASLIFGCHSSLMRR